MGITNPRFTDAGAAPGEALGWTLQTLVAGRRAAAFGPDPARAVEDFERWAAFFPAFDESAAVRAFFAPAMLGYEPFERGWSNDVFLAELTGGASEPCAFRGAPVEGFLAGWAGADPFAEWSDVAAVQGAFGGGAAEAFEMGWSHNEADVAGWSAISAAVATFDKGATTAELFAGTWPAATTI
jgi:hypothetical protein